ncbi:hypothetical protein MFIFM68171_02331 [Madurella fahalii]|uniref:Transcription elongation factor Eaf N-terminal domain-containing protein n=1 Tax=Madurella fahalii TaxID=1157608 RepID=A0ABQ0G2Y8_9PEZI
MAAAGLIDPTKPGRYPVILSDALLGKPSKEAYTGIRYNHRPTLSSDTAPGTARLKKSAKDGSYNLGFDDQGNKYQYNGIRTTDDGNYVLIFDPARKAFVLHRVDSTFHMNLTRTPTDTNAESLRKQFPHLDVKSGAASKPQKGKAADRAGTSKAATARAENTSKTKASSKPDKKNKTVSLTLPDPSASSAAPTPPSPSRQQQGKKKAEPSGKSDARATSPVESEGDDDVLTVEYPGGNPSSFQPAMNFSSANAVPLTRRWSEFAREIRGETDDEEMSDAPNAREGGDYREHSEEEGYEEEEEEDDDDEEDEESPRKMPHPADNYTMTNPVAVEPIRYEFDSESEDGDGDGKGNGHGDENGDEDFGDLEAEMLKEFDKVQNEGHESEVSEEE